MKLGNEMILFRKIGDAEDEGEVDFMIYVNQAQYEMRYIQKLYLFDLPSIFPHSEIVLQRLLFSI